jgi:hypothetical protein
MTSKPESATVVDLQQARLEKPSRYPDGRLVPPHTTYNPPPPYMVHPCQVIDLPVKAPAEPGKS